MKSTDRYIEQVFIEKLKENSFDKISIQMVCDEVKISKQSLYYHYDSLLDIFSQWMRRNLVKVLGDCITYKKWNDGYYKILKFFSDNRAVINNMYDSSCRDTMWNILNDLGRELITQAVQDVSSDFQIPVIQKDKEFMVDVYMYVFMGILKNYVEKGMKEDIDYITSRCEIMLGGSIKTKEESFFSVYKNVSYNSRNV